MAKIYDCFTFFNEYDLLEIRLKLLYPFVDKFVIAEANFTHSGKEKPFNFLNQKARFEPWADKIQYIPVQLSLQNIEFAEDEQSYNPANGSWTLENNQRLALGEIASELNDDDIVLVGDLDEIINPALLANIDLTTPKSMTQIYCNYFFNCQVANRHKWWNGTVACTGKYFKQHDAQQLRDKRNEFEKLKNAGWHFTYLGGVEAIQKKLSSFSHTEYNKEKYLDARYLEDAIKKGKDVLQRKHLKYIFIPISSYPLSLQKVLIQYPQFIKELSFIEKLKAFFSW